MTKEAETPGGVGDAFSCGMRFWEHKIQEHQVKALDTPGLSKYDQTDALEQLELSTLRWKQLQRRRARRLI